MNLHRIESSLFGMRGRARFAGVTLAILTSHVALADPRVVNISPTYVDFGSIKVGTTVSIPVTFKNLTNEDLQIAGGGISGSTEFRAQGGTCNGGFLPANGSCSINYHFRPTAAEQDFSASASVLAGANEVGSTGQTLQFAGRGTESLLQLSPTRVDFGAQQIGAMVEVKLTATNTDDDETVMFAGGGSLQPPFAGSTSCGAGVTPGNSCQMTRRFTPSTSAFAEDSTTLATYAPDIYESYALQYAGEGSTESGIVTFHPRGIDFGRIKLGRTATFEFVARNISAGNVVFGGGGLGNNAGGAFSGSTTCGGQIAAGAQCKFTYRFQPRVLGPVSTSTSISASGGSVNQGFQVHLAGTGIGTLARVTPTDIDFGQVLLTTSMTVPVTITNTSESPLTGFIGGSVNAPFGATNNCPASLPVNDSCQIAYRFQPGGNSLGPNATQTILSFTNATGVRPNVTISLTGTGYDFDRIFASGFD